MSTPKQYRKKPVVIEAMQLEDDLRQHIEVVGWIRSEGGEAFIPSFGDWLDIKTLEGTMHAELGDYIIRGVQGEFYPCKPDIFAATYEEVRP